MVFKTEDCVKAERAPGLSSSQKGFMMELQDLQDALKMEIQVHQKLVAQMKQDPQNTELKKQLHELQTKITTLSDKQKKVVEQLRKDLLVKQDQTDLQTQTQLASQLQPQAQSQAQAQAQSQAQSQFPLQLEVQVQAQPQLLPQPQHPIQPGSRASSLPPLHTPPSLPSPDNLSSLQSTLPGSPIPSSKSLPLLLSAIPSPRPSVAMVTTLSHTPKPGTTHHDSNSQNAPVSLQTTCPLTNQGLEAMRLVTKSTVVVHTSQPIRVPQFVPPRLAPRPACQPQVRPRPAQPVPQAPPPMLAPPQLSPRPILLANQVTASSLPPSPTPIRQVRILNGQSCSSPAPGIIITPLATPPTHLSSSHAPSKTVKVKTGESKSASSKHPSPSPHSPSPSPHSPTTRSTPPPRTPPRIKQEDTPQKLAFMVSLGLVTYDHLEEIQSRRQERKRRTTANPVYSGAVFEPERKKNTLLYLNSPLHQPNRKRGRPPKHSSMVALSPHPPGCLPPPSPILHRPAPPLTPPLPGPGPGDADVHEDLCAVCHCSGQLLMCDTCSRVYHLDCLAPPLKTVPRGMWMCPSCQDQMLDKEDAMEWPGTLAIVHSYIAYKAAKEEEKQRQVQWAKDLRQEREQLESRVKQLNISITRCMESKNSVLSRQRSMQTSLEKVKGLLCLIKGLKPLSPPQTTTQPPDDLTDEGTGHVSVDPWTAEPATEEPGDTQNNNNTKNKDIAENNNNNSSVTVKSHDVPENNKDVIEINKDDFENKDSRSGPGEQRRPNLGATAAGEEEEEEEEERKEEDEVEQKQEEVKLEEERSEGQEAKLPINNIVNTNKMSNMNSRATEINKEGEGEEETVEREEDVESQEREDITKLGKEEGGGEEEVDETKSNVRGEEEEEEKQGEMKEEEKKKEAEGPKENGNESDGEEEKEERMEEERVEEEKKETLSSLSKVSDPPLTLAPPPVGVTE